MKKNTDLARELRKNSTKQEKILWNIMRNHKFYGYEFRRQYPIGDYIVDFVCRNKKVIIELDSGQHNTEDTKLYDTKRTAYLNNLGYKVIRFWNNEVENNLSGIYKVLKQEFKIDDN